MAAKQSDKKDKKGDKKSKKRVSLEILTNRCVGCKKCVKGCKRKVFAIENKRAIISDLTLCVGCGKCAKKLCKFEAIDLAIKKK